MSDDGVPSAPVIEAAYRAAMAWRFRGVHGDARYARLSEAALRERVVIVPGQAARRAGPQPSRDANPARSRESASSQSPSMACR